MIERQVDLAAMIAHASVRERALARVGSVFLGLAVLGGVLGLAAAALGRGRWISLHPLLPAALLSAAVILALAVALIGWLRARDMSEWARIAREAEIEHGLRRGSVSGLLELPSAGVTARARARVGANLAGRELVPTRVRASRRRLAVLAAVLFAVGAGFTWSTATNPDALYALTHPIGAARGDLLEPLRLIDPPLTAARGTQPVIHISAKDRAVITLHSRATGAAWQSTRLSVRNGMARAALDSLDAAIAVFAADARGSSDTIVIRPADRAFISQLALEAVYPAHLERPPEPLAAVGTLSVPAGTHIRVRGRATVPLSGVELRGGDLRIRLPADAATFAGGITAHQSVVLEWIIAAEDGQPVDPPDPLHIVVDADELPRVEIIAPATDTSVTGETPLTLTIHASDDHGLGAVVLHVRNGVSQRTLPLEIPRAGGTATLTLDLRSLKAGERVALTATAEEATSSRRRVTTPPRVVAVLGGQEQRRVARAAAAEASALASGILREQRAVERRTAELAAARGNRLQGRDDPGTPQAPANGLASRARSVVEEQRSLSRRADSLAAATRALESRLARAGALDGGLAARLAEVRSLLERALTAELTARLQDAERAARENAGEPMRLALSDVAREQRRAREQLERVVQMLRRAAIEGSLETLRAEAGELAENVGAAARQESADRANRLASDIGRVLDQLRQEGAAAGISPTGRAQSRAGSAAAELGSGAPHGNAGAMALSETAAALAEARAAQIAEWKSELAADLDAAVQELAQLAGAEEALAERVAGGRGEWREEQGVLEESAAAIAERVARAARMSTLVSPRSDGLVRAARDRATRVSARAIPPRDRTQTAAEMRAAAAAMWAAAASLVRDRDRTNSARSASGFTELLEELQRLAREQGRINAAAAGLPLMLGGDGADNARDGARTLARQQRGVARALEEVGEADGGGRVGPLAAEAHRLADALERAAIDASVIERQQRLYHRLLEGGRLLAGDSGEEDDRREGTAADYDPSRLVRPAGVLPLGDRRHRLPAWADLRGLTAEERQMVLDYFERLNAAR